MPSKKRKVLEASKRVSPPHAKIAGKIAPDQRIEVTVMLRPRTTAESPSTRSEEAMRRGAELPENRRYLNRAELAAQRGADPVDIEKLERFAHENNLTLTQTNAAQRLVRLSGTVTDLSRAFGAKLRNYKIGKITFRGRTGALSVPSDVADAIVGVYGFDERSAATPHLRILGGISRAARKRKSSTRKTAAAPRQKKSLTSSAGPAATSQLRPFTALEVAKLYNFPTGLDGKDQCIAIIELNTRYANGQLGTGFSTPDLTAYFTKLKIPMPKVTAIGVGGGANLPNVNPDADGEVMLDIEVAGAVAPAAAIAVYFGLNTSQGFIEAVSTAVHDSVRNPSVISISWGGPEDAPYTEKQMRDGLEQLLQDAESLGITVCCAAGDNGSSDLPKYDENGNLDRDNKPHVDFPASSPFALACGGTTLVGNGSTISSEVVWNEGDPATPTDSNRPTGSGGGGVSNIFAKPSYQASVQVPKSPQGKTGRGVPDVAGNADSATGYLCKLAQISKLVPIGGTSAVAPLWAGLLALINQRLVGLGKKTAGFINPILYPSPSSFRDITQGNNDIDGTLKRYSAAPGWDPCTGMGSPDGMKIMKALGG